MNNMYLKEHYNDCDKLLVNFIDDEYCESFNVSDLIEDFLDEQFIAYNHAPSGNHIFINLMGVKSIDVSKKEEQNTFEESKKENERLKFELDRYKEMVNKYRYDTNEILYAIETRSKFDMDDVEVKVKDMLKNDGKVYD